MISHEKREWKSAFMRTLWLIAKFLKLGLIGWFRFFWWELTKRFRSSMMTVSTKQGVFTIVPTDQIISRSLYCRREYELGYTTKAMTFLRSIEKCPPRGRGTIVDVGANNGVISIGMLHTGELQKAIAIEPEPRNFALLQHNVNQNGFSDRFVCLPYAASNQKGDLLFELSPSNFGDHRVRMTSQPITTPNLYDEAERGVITVQSEQLDRLLADLPQEFTQDISVIWIDVQGYEGYVFMGAQNLLSKGIPVISEIWPYAIEKAGMTKEQYCLIAKSYWENYWVMQNGKFVPYSINDLGLLFDRIGYNEDFNIIYV
jgi:FkbM family methyltransferase